MGNRIKILLQRFSIVILGFIVYSNSLNNKFIWDDRLHILNNIFIKSWVNLPRVFCENMAAGAGYKSSFYRPIQTLTYMIDYSFWGLDVKGYHLTGIFIHILVAMAVYALVNILVNKRSVSFFAGILFVVHPLNVETVAFISDRADSLAALFMLLCIIFYIKYAGFKNTKAYILIILSYLLALLSKENSIILPALLFSYHYTFKKGIGDKKLMVITCLAFLYIVFRSVILSFSFPVIPALPVLLQRIPGFFAAITDYLRIFLFPLDLHMEYSYRLFHFTEPKVIFGAAVLFLSLAYAFIKRKSDGFTAFSIFWFFITLLPVSNIYPIGESYMAERWLYFPAIGLFFILADKLYLIYSIKRLKALMIVFLIIILGCYSFLTIKQNRYWRDPVSFYERTLEFNPESAKIYNEIGFEYEVAGRKKGAIAAYKKAIKYAPGSAGAYFNLANLYHAIGKDEEAKLMYKKAQEINKKAIKQYRATGKKYEDAQKYRKAVSAYKKALELNPADLRLSNDLARMYIFIGKYRKAVTLFKKILEAQPLFAVIHNNLAVAYYYNKNYDLAIKHCDKAIELGYSVSPEFRGLLKQYRE